MNVTATVEHRLALTDGTLAYDVAGSGPLVVLAHGIGDSRHAYRFLAPLVRAEGFRVANVDLRGCGASSAAWPSYTRADVADDLLALVEHLDDGTGAVLVGHSFAGGAATIAAARSSRVRAVVELAPFTRPQSLPLSGLRDRRYRRGMTRLLLTAALGRVRSWHRYLDHAYPTKPADWDAQLRENAAMLAEPGRMRALQRMGTASPADAGAHLADVACPALVVMGTLDPDWVDPVAEGAAVVAALTASVDARLAVLEGAGHYPHAQLPEATLAAVLPFLREHAGA